MGAKVIYKCACMKDEAQVDVPSRNEDEEIMSWMNILGAALTVDHRRRSPLCMSEKMEYAKIYISPNGQIGGEEMVN